MSDTPAAAPPAIPFWTLDRVAEALGPMLVGSAPRGLLAGALGLIRPALGLSQRFTRRTGGDQPGHLEGAASLRDELKTLRDRLMMVGGEN